MEHYSQHLQARHLARGGELRCAYIPGPLLTVSRPPPLGPRIDAHFVNTSLALARCDESSTGVTRHAVVEPLVLPHGPLHAFGGNNTQDVVAFVNSMLAAAAAAARSIHSQARPRVAADNSDWAESSPDGPPAFRFQPAITWGPGGPVSPACSAASTGFALPIVRPVLGRSWRLAFP